MYADSASSPVSGTKSGIPQESSPPGFASLSPSSLSFSKQPIGRSFSGRSVQYVASPTSSPFMPGSLEPDAPLPHSSSNAPPRIIKRYSSSLSQRQGRPLSSTAGSSQSAAPGLQGSTADVSSLPNSVNVPAYGLTRPLSTKISMESGLRRSYEGQAMGSASCPDDEEIQAFLKTLDALPQPPSLAAQAAHASRSHLPSTSSSLSIPSTQTAPSPLQESGGLPSLANTRAPMTRAQIDGALKRMAGSFNTGKLVENPAAPAKSTPESLSSASSTAGPSTVGLLTASRPRSSSQRISAADTETPATSGFRRQISEGSSLASRLLGTQTSSHSTTSPIIPFPQPPNVIKLAIVRSLPDNPAPLTADVPPPLMSAGLTPLSPQTTGGTSTATNETAFTRTSRRGPVLLRGGFGEQRQGTSPSHSPIREMTRQKGTAENTERQAEDQLGNWMRPAVGRSARTMASFGGTPALGHVSDRKPMGQSTAPSSLDAKGDFESSQAGETNRGRGREARPSNTYQE